MSKRGAFTLVELLIVVAILALLVSITMPSLMQVKVLARRSMCAVQMSQHSKALAAYVKHEHPFQIVHGEIARRLANHPDLVVRVGETTSEDIFHHRGSAVVWRKVE